MATERDVSRSLRALADFLDEHPDVPVSDVEAAPYITGTDEEERAEVDRLAAILGSSVEDAGSHYRVRRDFGAGVVYRAVAITAAHMAEYEEFQRKYRESQEA